MTPMPSKSLFKKDDTPKRMECIVAILRYEHHAVAVERLPELLKLPLEKLSELADAKYKHRAQAPEDVMRAAALVNEYERRCP